MVFLAGSDPPTVSHVEQLTTYNGYVFMKKWLPQSI